MNIIEQAGKVFEQNFPKTTWFERAIFFSWYCSIGDCTYCYMSTQKDKIKGNKMARRTTESILAELVLCKQYGWEIGFISGGHEAYSQVGFLGILEKMYKVSKEKFWINVGPLSEKELVLYQPYIKGVVGSIETVNEQLHDEVCPSKPVKPFLAMYKSAEKLGLQKAMTIILGLGETLDDFAKLEMFVKNYGITKIHFYGLNPQKGTVFENIKPPSKEYHAEWIAKTRIAFPTIDIQCGIWADKIDHIELLLRAGANSISKFPALKLFGTDSAKAVEIAGKKAGRIFNGTLTKRVKLDIDNLLVELTISREQKEKIKIKIQEYL